MGDKIINRKENKMNSEKRPVLICNDWFRQYPIVPECTEFARRHQDGTEETIGFFLPKEDLDEYVENVEKCINDLYDCINALKAEKKCLLEQIKECCEKSCKGENATSKPLIPKWRVCGDVHILVLNLSQKAKWEFVINTKTLNVVSYIADDDIAISREEVGTFDTLKDAKTKVNEYIGRLGECMMYFAENIKTERSGEE